MNPIFHSVTDYATVQQCLMTSMQATRLLEQTFTIVTFDLAMAKIAYNILWQSGDRFSSVIIHIGGFHTNVHISPLWDIWFLLVGLRKSSLRQAYAQVVPCIRF